MYQQESTVGIFVRTMLVSYLSCLGAIFLYEAVKQAMKAR